MDRAGRSVRLGKRISAGGVHYLILTCLFWLLFLGVADHQATLVLLPSLGESFDVRILARGILVTGYALGAALASPGQRGLIRPVRTKEMSPGRHPRFRRLFLAHLTDNIFHSNSSDPTGNRIGCRDPFNLYGGICRRLVSL